MSQPTTNQLLHKKDQKIAQLEQALAVEAALESVRSQTMRMQKSEELADIASLIFQQLKTLKVVVKEDRFHFSLHDEKMGRTQAWITKPNGQKIIKGFDFPIAQFPPLIQKNYARWKNTPKFERIALLENTVYKGKDLDGFLDLLASNPLFAKEKSIQALLQNRPDQMVQNAANFAHGVLVVTSTRQFAQQELRLLQRFAIVFEQTYTRFLDLQKVEAQAREAQIEAAMERIRSRAIAMRSSDELKEVIIEMRRQIDALGQLDLEASVIHLYTEGAKMFESFAAVRPPGESGEIVIANILFPVDAMRQIEYMIEMYHSDEQEYTIEFDKKMAEEWQEVMVKHARMIAERRVGFVANRRTSDNPEYWNFADFSQGSLLLVTHSPASEDTKEVLRKAAQVFDQAYTRFLDLQKAEAQAKEAQIEAALERVRAKAMSMHKSEDLADVLAVIFEQMHQLGFDSYHTIFGLIDLDKKLIEFWSQGLGAFQFPFRFEMPIIDNYVHNQGIADWHSGKEFSILEVAGKTKREYDEALFKSPDLANIPETVKNNILAMEKAYFSQAFTQHGSLYANGPTPLPEEQQGILVRFAKVLDLTYTRMLDLQKAETQARELEIVFQENERLLHSILPMSIAEQLKKSPQTIVKRFEQVSILFADIVGFTILSERLSPQEVVDILNGLFSQFDDLTDKYQLEKIKTIGDAYMVAAGVPEEKDNHAQLMFAFAKDMLQTLQDYNKIIGTNLKIRIGISSGPVVAGVIGKKKFAYDLWGNTVNTAARMEAYGRQDCIQVSPTTYAILKKDAAFEKIPKVEIKGKGTMDVYLWKN